MIDQEIIRELQDKMLKYREQCLDVRKSLQSSREPQYERGSEIEEMAGKITMIDRMERIDARIIDELEQIDMALNQIDKGTYGRCKACKRPISLKRLHVIPWTTLCKNCAQNRESISPSGIGHTEEELADDRILDSIWDELDSRGDMNVDRLNLHCENGTVYLSGKLPTVQEHQLAMEIIQEELGFEDVIDRVEIDELERRLYGEDADEESYEKVTGMLGQAPEKDPFTASEESFESMVPPDDMIVEDNR